jgi:hypothetical protein
MSKADQFWQYAKEAMLSASYAKTGDERQSLLDLARIWTQAALLERQHVNHDMPARGESRVRVHQSYHWPSGSPRVVAYSGFT